MHHYIIADGPRRTRVTSRDALAEAVRLTYGSRAYVVDADGVAGLEVRAYSGELRAYVHVVRAAAAWLVAQPQA